LAANGVVEGDPVGTAPGAVEGVLAGDEDGTEASVVIEVPALDDVAAGALAVCVAEGKKVALWPLKTCHWSHNKTMEKPKITHKMVRRMSFMTASF